MARLIVFALLCAATLSPLRLAAHDAAPAPLQAPSAFWAGPAMSGSWYSHDRSGEGLIVQVLADGTAVAFWFTYPPQGVPGEQAWLVAQGGRLDGDSIHFEQVYRPHGARFGDAFDSADVTNHAWGTLSLQFSDCAHAVLRYQGPDGWGAGERALQRLTSLDQLDCAGDTRSLLENGALAPTALHGHSAAWYAPARAGEGWIIEQLPGGLVALYWFTFGVDGEQAWMVALGTLEGNRAELVAQITGGARFGAAFDAAAVQRTDWGTITLQWDGCDALDVAYASHLPGYGSSSHHAVRLVQLASLPCRSALPAPSAGGSFTEHAPMPGPAQSELAVVGTDAGLYALGGFGGPRRFKYHDYATGRWTVLPDLPAGRHHLAAFALDGAVYMTGGAALGGGDQGTSMFRYDPFAQRWSAVPGPGPSYGSHAAVLNGRAYIGSSSGRLQEFDARNGRVRTLPVAPGPRDHSQLVAFLGELWLMGGRSPETGRVAIWNPASERWREGPTLNRVRGGFAAAVVGDRILVAGGEVLQPLYIEASVESYSAGGDAWVQGPWLPVPVHGVAGAAHAGRFYLVSGSTIAGAAEGATGRLFSYLPD